MPLKILMAQGFDLSSVEVGRVELRICCDKDVGKKRIVRFATPSLYVKLLYKSENFARIKLITCFKASINSRFNFQNNNKTKIYKVVPTEL